ncbi:MAG: DNA recombination protein RmuC [Gammaproteobacteria bacterium]|nr:DNA recombination protein RmuC [Gammaproteobacteria bacterium]
MKPYLAQIEEWASALLPAYWLASSILVFIIVLSIISSRSKRRDKVLSTEREQLALAQATNRQKIEQLEADRESAIDIADRNAEKIQSLIAQTAELRASREEKIAQVQSLEHERAGLREIQENSQRKISRLESDIREQKTKLEAEQDKLNELKHQFEQQKQELKNEFRVVSEKIISDRQKVLAEQNKEGVGALLKPLQEQIQGFEKRVNQVHDESVKGTATLRAEIENVQKMGISMQAEASNLANALKGDAQQRGAWGEAQLERTLELSGLVQHDHYEKQTSFLDQQGKRKQTDYIIKLPEDKCIIIDSKVSLNAYEKACAGEIEDQSSAMKLHVAAVRRHIDELASKEYTNLSSLHSPDFILMFMPIEPAYIEAMKHDTELFAYGYARNVILVSHTTLVPILRTVANLWMLDRSNKEARLIGEKASDIYNSVATVSERLVKLGKTLNTASTHYNDTITSLAGVQGLQGKVARFSELSSKATKAMPAVEEKNIEFETTKLQASALPEPASENPKGD